MKRILFLSVFSILTLTMFTACEPGVEDDDGFAGVYDMYGIYTKLCYNDQCFWQNIPGYDLSGCYVEMDGQAEATDDSTGVIVMDFLLSRTCSNSTSLTHNFFSGNYVLQDDQLILSSYDGYMVDRFTVTRRRGHTFLGFSGTNAGWSIDVNFDLVKADCHSTNLREAGRCYIGPECFDTPLLTCVTHESCERYLVNNGLRGSWSSNRDNVCINPVPSP